MLTLVFGRAREASHLLLDENAPHHTVRGVTVINAPSSVLSRIATIQSRLQVNAPAVDPSSIAPTTSGFDPFGAAYQAALVQAPTGEGTGVESGTSQIPEPAGFGSEGAAARAVRTGFAVRTGAASTPSTTSAGALAGEDVARMAYQAGFRGDDLVKVVAISKRESNWRPDAFNGNAGTGDRSFGLMQINMIGDLGPARLRQFGLTSSDQLLDPQTNLNAAFRMYSDAGGSLNAWGGYKGLSNTFNTDVDSARAVVASAGVADG